MPNSTGVTVTVGAGDIVNVSIADALIIRDVGNSSEGLNLDSLAPLSNLSALRIVSRVGVNYALSDPNSADSVWAIAGMTATAVNAATPFIPVRNTAFSDAGWNWVRGSPIFLGPSGTLTQTPPSSGYLVVVAKVLDPQTIFLEIEEPIDL